MIIKLRHCNNIDAAEVEIVDGRLNIKYGINGTGKSTIAKAIRSVVQSRTTGNADLLELRPFKYRKGGADPIVEGADTIASVEIFDESCINEIVFKPDELLKGSFDIFIRGQAYDDGLAEIEAQISIMNNALNRDPEIVDLLDDFKEISECFGKETKVGIHASSTLAKALGSGNRVTHVPVGLEPYKPYIQHDENYKWLKWQVGGRDFEKIDDNCPYCTGKINQMRDVIAKVGEIYKPKEIEGLNLIIGAFDRLNKYFSGETKGRISQFVHSVDGYTGDQVAYLRGVREEIDRLAQKFHNARNLSFVSLKDVDALKDCLMEYRIELPLYVHLQSEETEKKVGLVNTAIDELIEKARVLQGLMNKQKGIVEALVQKHSGGINEFLKNAGYCYRVALLDSGDGMPRLKLIHHGTDEKVENAKNHLSYGERNAFALVLFMYHVLKVNPDLIVLDDPISSFDKNKKFAIVEMLFKKGLESLAGRTVLMLTHDLEPLVDMVLHHSDRFPKPFASFLQNSRGAISEAVIKRRDLQTFTQIADRCIFR